MLNDRIFRCRPSRERQGEDRVDIIRACRINGVYIDSAPPDIFTAPNDRIALAGRELFGILVRLRGGRNDLHRDLIRAVATVHGHAVVVVRTVGRDVLAVPVQHRALR